jgi:UDP-GlcNAc:undecaprenyl-phosphate GlcNAc-1-phosphate transferase
MSFTLAAAEQSEVLHGFRYPLLTGVIALVVTWVVTPWVRKLAIAKGAVDDPKADDRRVHTEPIPRWGGIAIFAGIIISLACVMPKAYEGRALMPMYLIGILLCSALVVIMGALDDLYQFKAKVQALFLLGIGFAVQLFVTHGLHGRTIGVQIVGLGSGSGWVDFGWWAYPLTAVYLFVISKTMDTIDGIDGLAAGISAITATTLCIVAGYFVLNHRNLDQSAYQELPRVALISAAIAGASLGFLRHNYNPAKIFMGTGGAQLLGFMLATISIVGVLKTAAAAALVIPIFAFGVPIFDAAFVVIRRIASHQPITQADKRHLHHTLLGKGLSQRQAVWVLYLATAVLCGALLLVVRKYV